MSNKPDCVLWIGDSRGIYIPHDFATIFVERDKHVSGVSADDWAILEAGPGHDLYWDAWDVVLNSATVTDGNGNKYRVEQDGDCWLVPHGMEFSDETGWYVWPENENVE